MMRMRWGEERRPSSVHRAPVGGAVALLCLAAACSGPTEADPLSASSPPPSLKIVVATNVYALEWVIQRVGGDYVDVRDFETKVHESRELPEHDRQLIREADAVIYAGNVALVVQQEFDRRPEDARVTDIARQESIQLLPADPELRDDALLDGMDPHVWLDPRDRMLSIVNAVQRSLVKATARDDRFDDAGIDFSKVFDDNARKVVDDLRELHETLDARLRICLNRHIVAEHPAFAYLAEAYGLEQLAINKPSRVPLDPIVEERQRERLRELWEGERQRTIFLDRGQVKLGSPNDGRKFVDNLANDFDARYRYLETLEERPAPQSAEEQPDYLQTMRANMNAIKEGLGCDR